jgi:glycosyltransferase involved in cell wall biosynthesis
MENIEVIYVPRSGNSWVLLFRFLLQSLRITYQGKYSIVFTIQFKLSFLIGLLARGNLKILDFRTGDLSDHSLLRWFRNRMMQFDALFFRRISVVSEGLMDLLGLRRSKTKILPLGADTISSKQHTYQRLDLLYVGAIHHRNIYQTVEGIRILLDEDLSLRDQITYTIVGFGNQGVIEHLIDTIDRLELRDIVSFQGRIKYSELGPFFDQCNVGISYIPITPYYEYQPATKTFEYLLSGLFTIATDTRENRRIIDNENGILCKDTPEAFARALQQMYSMRHVISEENVRASVKEYQWENIVNSVLVPLLDC